MILYGDRMGVSGGSFGGGRGCPPEKDTERREERAGRVNNSYVTISKGA